MLAFQRDDNLTAMLFPSMTQGGYWKIKKVPSDDKCEWTERAVGPSGEWQIKPRAGDVACINYTPVHPTLSQEELSQRWTAIRKSKEHRRADRESAFIEACLMGNRATDLMYAESMEEARLLCSALEAGSDDLPPFEEGLAAAGFLENQPSRYETRPRTYRSWSLKVKSGEFNIVVRNPDFDDLEYGDIHCTYSTTATKWHNVFLLPADRGSERNAEFRLFNFYPPAARDLRCVALAHLLNVIEKRQQRERTRLGTPLGGAIPRYDF